MAKKSGVDALKERLGGRVREWQEWSPRRFYVEVAPADIVETARILWADLGARFQIASGVDNGREIEIIYHFAFDREDTVVNIRVRLDRAKPEIESIAPVFVGAEWIEREMWELLGIQFRNHPNLKRLLLADDWPEGNYPLRRDWNSRARRRM